MPFLSLQRMKIVKSVFSYRSKDHSITRMHLRDERNFFYRVLPVCSVVFIGFIFVDLIAAPSGSMFQFLLLRVGAICSSYLVWVLTRGRLRYGLRNILSTAPWLLSVQYIMVSNHIVQSTYFAGQALVLFYAAIYLPLKLKYSLIVNGTLMLPFLIWSSLSFLTADSGTLVSLLMSVGTIATCALGSDQLAKSFLEEVTAAELLARILGNREKDIRNKAEEILNRKTFETQFAPQVVAAVLKDPKSVLEMHQTEICICVIDIENSTQKANTIDPLKYKEVIEEAYDVFSSACLKWNVTVDKFTGDGAQAFAGAPYSDKDDLRRAISACSDAIQMLHARKPRLEALWAGTLNIRFSVCRGRALVGFLGKGALKSFTAIGDSVSFAHRICGIGEPWQIAVSSLSGSLIPNLRDDVVVANASVTGLKGFDGKKFNVFSISPSLNNNELEDLGRCTLCATPLVLQESENGLPRIECPSCISRVSSATGKAA